MVNRIVLILFVTTLLFAQTPSKVPEFLGVQLGKTLDDQFPECKTYNYGTQEYKEWGDHDPSGFRCYVKDLGYILDHNYARFSYDNLEEAMNARETYYKAALAQAKTDSDTGQVGYVGTSYDMDGFKETLSALKAKRGAPTSCSTTVVKNLMGARLNQTHCEWKQPWGVIAVTGPSSDDLTMFDVWAITNHQIYLRKQERLANQKQQSKDF
jgi:hypothetical protein